MEDVSEVLESGSRCLRDLWNLHFRGPTDEPSACPAVLQDLYVEIAARLFGALVLFKLDRLPWLEGFRREPFPFLVVAPPPDCQVRLLVNRRLPGFGNQYWDAFGDRIGGSDATLHFIGWFDWNFYGRHEHEHVYVRVAEFPTHPEFIGRDALIERRSTQVLFDPSVD